ncbi:phage virion morphogenesis protein [Pasteurellaceae bacterium HPA106]|uniref:phage virion morphogenesis protein n=1 Tax=Spirabiliibacterium pneumoniae TaxID=221400 RepID=UPI001AAE09EC|nr:phage virion morphogenesis protein [Spirabiliibacterium pneumoniae]MBE2895574.1 phage virion morphogenesis protein [Spirabiliibacterium pneumoniae]
MSALNGLTQSSIKRLKTDFKLLTLSREKKRQVLQRTAWRMKDKAKKAVSQQKSPDGKSWEKRKKGSGKMLKHRAQYLKTKGQGANKVKMGYTIPSSARIAAEHQYGLEVELASNSKLTTADRVRLNKIIHNPATAKQADKLRTLGYQIQLKGGKKKRATIRDIQNRLTVGQAGLIIRLMNEKLKKEAQAAKSQGGKIKLPERPFLDENTQRNADILSQELGKVLKPVAKK